MVHASQSLHDLARKAKDTPDLLSSDQKRHLAEHVLKEKDKASDIEVKAAQNVFGEPDNASPSDVSLLGRKVSGIK